VLRYNLTKRTAAAETDEKRPIIYIIIHLHIVYNILYYYVYICNIIAIYVIILVRPSVAIRTMAVITMPNILVRAERFYSRVCINIYISVDAARIYRLGRFNRSQPGRRYMRPYVPQCCSSRYVIYRTRIHIHYI